MPARAQGLAHAAAALLLIALGGCGGDDAREPASGRDAAVVDGDGGGLADGGGRSDGGGGPGNSGGSGAADAGSGEPGADIIPDDCPELAPNTPPETLRCTGLYADVEAKELSPGVREFKPALELWSDGADKTRWIYLPPGTQIDASDPDRWTFPVGTRLFKEFKWNGKRAETRMFWKRSELRWERAAYRWNEDETEATRFGGGEVEVGGESYVIPSAKECDQCHKGRPDRVLGFERVLLGLDGAEGLTLAELEGADLLAGADAAEVALGDDGTGEAAAALGWLHVNCGVSCHNGNSSAEAYRTDLRLQLDADDAQGGSLAGSDARTTTIGQTATTPRWDGRTRVVPGSPEDSLLYWLISMRNPASRRDQMPPIASRVVDEQGAEQVAAWIRALDPDEENSGAESSSDAGMEQP